MKILSTCPTCAKTEEWEYVTGEPGNCVCGSRRLPEATAHFLESGGFNQCPICGCPHIYRQKDFNRNFGVLLIVIGVALAYWTYGLSLVIVTVIDFALFRFVKELGVCYRCHAQFRKSDAITKLDPFNLSLHDFYKSVSTAGTSGSDSESHSH